MYRSLVLGLLGACVMLLAQRPITYIHVAAPSPEGSTPAFVMAPVANTPPTIIDVGTQLCAQGTSTVAAWRSFTAASCDAIQLSSLLHLAADERVTAIEDRPVTSAADVAAFYSPRAPGSYVDVTVAGPRGERRVILLMH